MLKFTITPAVDSDLAGVAASIIGVNRETAELILRFKDGSSIFAKPEHVVLKDD